MIPKYPNWGIFLIFVQHVNLIPDIFEALTALNCETFPPYDLNTLTC